MKVLTLLPALLAAIVRVESPVGGQATASNAPASAAHSIQASEQAAGFEERIALDSSSTTIRYECLKTLSDQLMTIAHTARGPLPLVIWESTSFGAQWSPLKRCQTVSSRFQKFSDMDQMQYVSTGVVNSSNVLCVSGANGNCLQDGLLITLEASDDPVTVLEKMFDFKIPITRGPRVVKIATVLEPKEPIPAESLQPTTPLSEE